MSHPAFFSAISLGLVACVAWGNARAADPSIRLNVPATVASVPAQQAYYLENIPGTDMHRKVYIFSRLDRNGNGFLERRELPKDMHKLRSQFMQADWDHNGRLSLIEYRNWLHGRIPRYTEIFHGYVVQGVGR